MKITTEVLVLWSALGIGAAVATYLYLSRKRENLAYLDQYEMQDHYKNRVVLGDATVPPWPVVNTATTSLANVQRRGIARDKQWYDQHPQCLYSNLDFL